MPWRGTTYLPATSRIYAGESPIRLRVLPSSGLMEGQGTPDQDPSPPSQGCDVARVERAFVRPSGSYWGWLGGFGASWGVQAGRGTDIVQKQKVFGSFVRTLFSQPCQL